MNKKVKWSVISVSTLTFLTFGGLVANNHKTSSSTNTTSNTTTSTNTSNQNQTHQDRSKRENNSQQNDEWGQDQFQQAPSGGFDQGSASSGGSR